MYSSVKELASNHPELDDSGFALAANVRELREDLPYDLGWGLQIRRAEPNEVETIKRLLLMLIEQAPLTPSRNPYETELDSLQMHGSHAYTLTTRGLLEHNWRYHVITFPAPAASSHPWERIFEFVDSTVLSRFPIKRGPAVVKAQAVVSVDFPPMRNVWSELVCDDDRFLSLDRSDLDELRSVHEKLIHVRKNDHDFLRLGIDHMIELDDVPESSDLRFLGYISVLESLITHKPKKEDPYDSLTRQVRKKMILVGGRAALPMPYETFYTNVPKETLWAKIYDYRSEIAHGTPPDFKGKLQCLKDRNTAREFVRQATVTLMRQALEEPELIRDLRNC